MKNNILIDYLPTSVKIASTDYAVNYSFRAGILIELYLFNRNLSDEEKIIKCLRLFYKENIPLNIEEAMQKMIEFQFRNSREEKGQAEIDQRKKKQKRAYDFEQDANYIFSACLTQYGINLNRMKDEELHWWEFLAMMQSLNDNLMFSKIMYWRLADTAGMAKGEKKFVLEMKKKYALKDPTSPEKKLALADRNKQMLDYVNCRYAEVQKEMRRREENGNYNS